MLIYAAKEISNSSKAMDVSQVWKAADRYMHTFYSLPEYDHNVFLLFSLLSFIITHLQRRKVAPNQEDLLENKVDEFEQLLKVCIHRTACFLSFIPVHGILESTRRPCLPLEI